jgi:hypothetical protein
VAVDAFLELDVYVIRGMIDKDATTGEHFFIRSLSF